MQRNKIKVGETYAVVKRMGRDAAEYNSVPAKVIEMGVEYDATRYGTFRSHKVPMNDGIRVEFVEPVLGQGHYKYETLSSAKKRLKPSAFEEAKKQAVTTTVLEGSKYVLRPWAEVEEMRARWAEERKQRAEKMDAIGDMVEPTYNAVQLELAERGVMFEYKASTQPGTEKGRLIDATFTFGLDQLAALLGVAVKP